MFLKIVSVSMLFYCLLAIGLGLMGYTHVDLGGPFMTFMATVSRELEAFKIEIPDIPQIPRYVYTSPSGQTDIFSILANILNALISFVNMFVTTFNMIIGLVNVVIGLLQFIFIILRNLILFKDSAVPSPSPSLPVL